MVRSTIFSRSTSAMNARAARMKRPTAVSSKALGDELEARLNTLELVEQYPDVVLAPGKTVNRVRDDDVGLAPSQRCPEFVQAIALERRAACRVADAANDAPPPVLGELDARSLLDRGQGRGSGFSGICCVFSRPDQTSPVSG